MKIKQLPIDTFCDELTESLWQNSFDPIGGIGCHGLQRLGKDIITYISFNDFETIINDKEIRLEICIYKPAFRKWKIYFKGGRKSILNIRVQKKLQKNYFMKKEIY